ncbi:hypothetical protein Tco_0724348 [Tanacetum coccineum]
MLRVLQELSLQEPTWETGLFHGLKDKCVVLVQVKQVDKFYLRRTSHFWQIKEYLKPQAHTDAKVALMANLSHYGSDALAEVHNHDNVNNNMINQAVQVLTVLLNNSNVVNHSETEITSDSNIIPYSQYLIESQQPTVQNSNSSAQQDALILSVIEQLKTQVANCTKINLENKSVNDTLTAKLERYKEQVKVLNKGQNVDLKSNNNISNSYAQSVEIDHLKQTISEHLKERSLMQMSCSSQKRFLRKVNLRTLIGKYYRKVDQTR